MILLRTVRGTDKQKDKKGKHMSSDPDGGDITIFCFAFFFLYEDRLHIL